MMILSSATVLYFLLPSSILFNFPFRFVESSEPLWKGYFYTVLIILATVSTTVINNQYAFKQWMIGLQVGANGIVVLNIEARKRVKSKRWSLHTALLAMLCQQNKLSLAFDFPRRSNTAMTGFDLNANRGRGELWTENLTFVWNYLKISLWKVYTSRFSIVFHEIAEQLHVY